ncbi:hypothetical protein P153DRAFT_201060 [Dothidotthia symphoricarpi CBS 119687]|uniref:Uncharacterized protein n=1 Tax=Dothidotthia symphoricarpi CBS 119687 TaxID=1392245 RepID=A0A6A6AKP2_9PLEO|nr:uncharacterized protein P153DRAFT_201060 [Dothidotthia symphoricarpi CBS 119687]KAF2131688.1 hypothetical protein P153DRAFT_201060 [Dothidotthia symphoricarpi CBS 119687]
MGTALGGSQEKVCFSLRYPLLRVFFCFLQFFALLTAFFCVGLFFCLQARCSGWWAGTAGHRIIIIVIYIDEVFCFSRGSLVIVFCLLRHIAMCVCSRSGKQPACI